MDLDAHGCFCFERNISGFGAFCSGPGRSTHLPQTSRFRTSRFYGNPLINRLISQQINHPLYPFTLEIKIDRQIDRQTDKREPFVLVGSIIFRQPGSINKIDISFIYIFCHQSLSNEKCYQTKNENFDIFDSNLLI